MPYSSAPPPLPKPVDVTPQMVVQIPPVKITDVVELEPVPVAETLPPDFEPDSEDASPPVPNSEPPLPPKGEEEPVEFLASSRVELRPSRPRK